MSREPTQFIAMQECSAGNSEVGEMWTATAAFPPTATLAEVWKWAKAKGGGRLMLRDDDNSYPPKPTP